MTFKVKDGLSLGSTTILDASGNVTVPSKLTLSNATASQSSLNIGAGSADPTTPIQGDVWYNSGNLNVRQVSATKTLAFTNSANDFTAATITASTGFAGTLTGTASKATNLVGGVAGSLPYQTAADTSAMLAIGTAGKILQAGASAPTWSTFTIPTTATTGKLLIGNGTNWVETSATYPSSTTVNRILYSSATNAVSEIATANSSVLVTNASGVPAWGTTLPAVSITTSVTVPTIYGSSAASGALSLSTTSDVTKGTLTVGDSNAGILTVQGQTVNVKVGAAGSSGFLKVAATTGLVSIDTNTYLTGYTETDTLATVTGRGSSTTTSSTFSGGLVASGALAITLGNATNNFITTNTVGVSNYFETAGTSTTTVTGGQNIYTGTNTNVSGGGSGSISINTGNGLFSGAVTINTGTATGTTTNSGILTIRTGDGGSTTGAGGAINIYTGSGGGTGVGGLLSLYTKDSVNAGAISIKPGASSTTTSGAAGNNITVSGGNVSGASTNGGKVSITGGAASGTTSVVAGAVEIIGGVATGATGTKVGGSVSIDGGYPVTGGTSTAGSVNVGTSYTVGAAGTVAVNVGHSSSTTTITGTVKLPTVGTSGFVKLTAGGQLTNDTNTYLTSYTDTNTTYSVSSSAQTGGAGLDLVAGGSGSGTDTVTFKGSGSTVVTSTDVNTITISTTVNDGTLSTAASSAGSTNTAVALSLSGTYSANSSSNATISALVGPALSALSTTMTGATSGFLKKASQDTYSIDTNTYLTSSTGVTTISFGTTGLTPNSATSGAVTVAGTLIPANGGTGLSTVTNAGELYYGNTTSAMGRIAPVAAGSILVSNGVAAAPVWSASPSITSLTTSGDLTVGGNLIVNGTSTTVNSTVTTIDDPILTLGGDTSTAETSKDRGIEFKWAGAAVTISSYTGNATTTVTGTVASTTGWIAGDIITISGATGTEQAKLNGTWTIASVPTGTTFTFVVSTAVATGALTTTLGNTIRSKNGFFGLDQSTGNFTFIPQANNASEVFSGTVGNLDIGKVNKVAITAPTTSATLTIADGKTLAVNNSITIAGTDSTTITLPSTTGTVALNNQTMFIGTTAVAINRSTAEQDLTGITSVTGTSSAALYTSNATSVASGSVAVSSGTTTTSGTSGSVSISTGASAATSGNISLTTGSGVTSGNISIDVGVGSTTDGSINIGTSNPAAGITIGKSGTPLKIIPSSLAAGLLKIDANGNVSSDATAYNTGTVTSVSGTAPITSTGGTTPAIGITAATTTAAGSMSAADKTKLDGIAAGATANTGTVTSVTGTAPISVATGTTTPAISMAAATSTVNGYMTSTYAAKLDGIAAGATANTGTVTSVATGTGLSGGPITSTGTISLANTTVTAGSYTTANITVDAQGRITAASSGTGGAAITDDTTTDATRYLLWDDVTTGNATSVGVSSSKLYFNPASGTLNATTFNSLSDVNHKENIETLVDATETVNNLNGVSFNWKENGKKSYGVIAQELEKILPELVEGTDVKTVNYAGLVGFLINAVKELDERIKVLENK